MSLDLKMEIDTVELIDERTNEKVFYNHRVFRKIIEGLIVFYVRLDKEKAKFYFDKCKYFNQPSSYLDVVFLTHEIECHWAMIAVYGNNYWLPENGSHLVLSLKENNAWVTSFCNSNNLPSGYYEYID